MFGLRSAKRLSEIEAQVRSLFSRVQQDGEMCSSACTKGARDGLNLASNMRMRGTDDRRIFLALADRATPMRGQPSCHQLGLGLVSFLYECRAQSTRRSLLLASRIQDHVTTILENRVHALEKALGMHVEPNRKPEAAPEHRSVLLRMGYTNEDIDSMSAEEIDEELSNARGYVIKPGG